MIQSRKVRSADFLSKFVIVLAIFLSGISLYYPVLAQRPFAGDGAVWFYSVLVHHVPYYDHSYFRVFDTVLQWPAVALLKLFPDLGAKAPLYLLNLFYSIHPAISLAACYVILKRKKALEYLPYAVLSFAWVTQSTLAFAVGIVPVSLSVFWPLLLLSIAPGPTRRRDLLAVAALTICLALTYEAALLFCALVFTIWIFRWKRSKRKEELGCALISLIATSWLTYRALGPMAGSNRFFFESLGRGLDIYRIYGLTSIAFLAVYVFSGKRIVAILGFVAPTVWLVFEWMRLPNPPGIIWAYDSRTTAIPIALLIAITATANRCLNKPINRTVLIKWAALACIVSASYSTVGTYHWQESLEAFRKKTQVAGCTEIPLKEFRITAMPGGFGDWSLPQLSILLQESRSIRSLLMVAPWDGFYWAGPPKMSEQPCRDYALKMIQNEFGNLERSENYFNYTPLLEELRKTQ